MGRDSFFKACKETARVFKSYSFESALLCHHNDMDGLTSGAILSRAIEREGIRIRRYCLEKPYPEVVRVLLAESTNPAEAVIFADFSSGMLKVISQLNTHRKQLFVFDHHQIESVSDANIHVLNCLAHGVSSDPDCSASAIAALFAIELDGNNKDLVKLGALGAIGDGFVDSTGRLTGLNLACEELAEKNNSIRLENGYQFNFGNWHDATDLKRQINALGSFAYFSGGPDQAIKFLLDGGIPSLGLLSDPYEKQFRTAMAEFIEQRPMSSKGLMQWFTLGEEFLKFGVKTVGLVCEEMLARTFADNAKYILGFQKVPDSIPGLGSIKLNQIKVSMRVPGKLKPRIAEGKLPDLTTLLPKATRKVGGFVDACHPYAASTTIAPGGEEALLREIMAQLPND